MKLSSDASTESLIELLRNVHAEGSRLIYGERKPDRFKREIWKGMARQVAANLQARLDGVPVSALEGVANEFSDVELMAALAILIDRTTA